MNLIQFTDKGIYCPEGDFYIDSWKPVQKSLITHGHSDHARWGNQQYICSKTSVPVLKHRLGHSVRIQGVSFGESFRVNGVTISFHPAGHIIGSAQIRIEKNGEVWVISGDYKLEEDGISTPFEPVRCHHFITESTFGLPIYKWPDPAIVFDQINSWWSQNKEEGKVSVIAAYALGKAQRVLQGVDSSIGKIFTHGAVQNMNDALIDSGVNLRKTEKIEDKMKFSDLKGSMIIAPPSSLGSNWMNRFKQVSTAFASGWMAIRGTRRRRSADRGFVLSDHCDWDGLNHAIKQTGAHFIYPTHGYTDIFSQWLRENGYEVNEVKTKFEVDSLEKTGE